VLGQAPKIRVNKKAAATGASRSIRRQKEVRPRKSFNGGRDSKREAGWSEKGKSPGPGGEEEESKPSERPWTFESNRKRKKGGAQGPGLTGAEGATL